MSTLRPGPPVANLRPVAAPTRPNRQVQAGPSVLHRLVTFVAALSLLGLAFDAWGSIVPLPPVGAVSVAAFGALLVLLPWVLATRSAAVLRRLDLAVLVLGLVLLGATVAANLYANPGYGTDEAAFVQDAARLLLHGKDPYGRDLLPALARYRVPVQFATGTLSGGTVSTLGYPDLPVLWTSLFVVLTHGVQSAIVAEVAALAVSMVLAFVLLPDELRALAVLVTAGIPILAGYAEAGVVDMVLVPFLMVAAYRWTAVGRTGRLSRADLGRAACLGLAAAAQQLAWFVAPFLLVGIWQARRATHGRAAATRLAAHFGLVAAAAFLAVNAPFLALSPRAWVTGVVAPLVQHAIPYGQGLVDLSLFFGLGGGNLVAFTLAAVLAYLGVLVAFAHWSDRLARAALVLPVVALFLPTRSLAEYFMTLVSVWVVAALTVEAPRRLARRAGAGTGLVPGLAAVLLLAGAGMAGAALATPAPLVLRIRSVTTNGQLLSIWEASVQVTNRTDRSLEPHFAANYLGQQTSFWNVTAGPRRLGPHATATYELAAPNLGSMPPITTALRLQAVTASPETVSSSPLFLPSRFQAYLTPPYEDRVLRLGDRVTFRVQLRSPYGRPVHEAGVEVALGQLVYEQGAEIPAEARIDHAYVGQSPVLARTDAKGVATFSVTDGSYQGNPVYFQAWVQPRKGYPYGYSEVVSVLWRPPARR